MDREKSNPLASKEAEMAYLGSLMFDRSKIAETAEGMDRSMFTVPAHQIIFEKIVDLAAKGIDGDIVVMNDELRTNGTWQAVGGAQYLMALVESVPHAENAKQYGATIKDLWQRRVLSQMVAEIGREVGDTSTPIDPMACINRAIVAVGNAQGNAALIYLESLVEEAFNVKADEKPVVTRIGKIDGNINLFAPGEMTILAARPSIGKSSLMRQMIENAATAGVALVFSMEVTATTLTQQFICEFAGVPFSDWRARRVTEDQDQAVAIATTRPELANIAVFKKPSISALDVSLAIGRVQASGRRVVAVFIDYLGLMKHDRAERHDLAVGSTTRMLKQIAVERKVPVILLAQLNREVERRGPGGDRPRLADLRDSGNIEQDADNVLFLWRKADKEEYKIEEERVLTIAKHRNGEVLEMDLMFNKPMGRFKEVNERGQAAPVAEWYSK